MADLSTPGPLFFFQISHDGDSTAFPDFHAALICYVCIYSWVVAVVSIILSCGKAGAESTHTHTELFEILTYLIQLNCKDSTLCMIAELQLQNVVNSKSKSSVQSLLGRRKTCWGHPEAVVRCGIPREGTAGTIPEGAAAIFLWLFFIFCFCTSYRGV